MSDALPLIFAAYPVVITGVALAWLLSYPHRGGRNWLARLLACGSVIAFVYMTAPWAYTSYYLRYVALGLFVVAAVLSYFRARRDGHRISVSDSRTAGPSILVFVLFVVLNGLAIRSYYPSGRTAELTFPLGSGTYYVLQGGTSMITNPFHALYGSPLAMDIVKLNAFGNRAQGVVPRELNAYEIFGDRLYSPCRGGVVGVRDGQPNNPPGHPDTDNPAGNYVILKCDEAKVTMAHLKRGSIKVTVGETVTPESHLAEIGNSGNTLEPHLHIEAARNGVGLGLLFEGRSLSVNSLVDGQNSARRTAIVK